MFGSREVGLLAVAPLAVTLLAVPSFSACGDDAARTDDDAAVDDDGQQPEPVCGNGKLEAEERCDEGEVTGAVGHCLADCSRMPNGVSIDGDVLAFLTEVAGPRVEGATVTILEHPEMKVVTEADGHFGFSGLVEGEDVTLLVEHSDMKTTQTATVTLGPFGLAPFSVQVVPKSLFTALSALVPLPIEEDTHCVIASTVARFGGSLYVHLRQGLPDVAVSLAPAPPEGSGPIYFDERVLPDPGLLATSIDGGVFFYRVPPGQYVMYAAREGYAFNEVRVQCRAGVVVNAGPPNGLVAHGRVPVPIITLPIVETAYTAVGDALCEATSACVNEGGEDLYPAAMGRSCKNLFRNAWASIDEDCAVGGVFREAARAVYACRTAGPCEVTLGEDEACPAEEEAFRAAEATYGACVAAKP